MGMRNCSPPDAFVRLPTASTYGYSQTSPMMDANISALLVELNDLQDQSETVLFRQCGECLYLGLDREGMVTDGYKMPVHWYCNDCCIHCNKCGGYYVGDYHDLYCE